MRKLLHGGTLLLTLLMLGCLLPAWGQMDRASDASVLLRAASFGATMGTATVYLLSEYEPDRWIVQAQLGAPSSVAWAVKDAPMGGPNAGYVVFVNGENETMTLDVLKIDTCFGTTGEIRIGW